jgi:hypothetical protein
MEEFFKGLLERAQYYEQFESFRTTNLPGLFGDTEEVLKIKIPTIST